MKPCDPCLQFNMPVNRIKSINEIIQLTCKCFNIPNNMLLSTSRSRSLCEKRYFLMKYLKKKTQLSLSEIATLLGKKNHTSIVHGLLKIDQLMSIYPSIIAEYEKMVDFIENNNP